MYLMHVGSLWKIYLFTHVHKSKMKSFKLLYDVSWIVLVGEHYLADSFA